MKLTKYKNEIKVWSYTKVEKSSACFEFALPPYEQYLPFTLVSGELPTEIIFLRP